LPLGDYGAGRSTLDTHLVIADQGKKLANVKIRVHGNYAFSAVEGGNKHSRQAESFQKRLLEQIQKLK
jgi:hypothetical protein